MRSVVNPTNFSRWSYDAFHNGANHYTKTSAGYDAFELAKMYGNIQCTEILENYNKKIK